MSSSSSLWRRGACLLPRASGSSLFATGAESATGKPRGSIGPPKENPSYLSAEIERMKKAYEKYNETPPKPFKLKQSAGDLELLLARHKGPEDIQVRCELLFHPRGGPPDELTMEELDDEVGEEKKAIANITVTITKGGPQALEVNVDCDRRGYAVNSIIYRENRDRKDDEDDYFPAFWRIGPKLRAELHNFLEVRGFNEKFACWVHDQMDDKAFRHRMRHLEKINAFREDRKPQQ